MDILRPAFGLLIVCGCWKPCSWTSSWKGTAYTVYTILLYLVVHTFTLSQFTEVVLHVRNADEFTDSIYMLLAAICSCCKINALLFNRETIKTLTTMLGGRPYKPANAEEVEIRNKFDRNIGSRTVQYLILVETTVVCMILSSLYADFRLKRLTYRAWLPFDYSDLSVYVFTYVHQMLGVCLYALSNVACDSIVCGLLVHACSQIEILQHRLKQINPETTDGILDCVRYHNRIYKYGALINEKFRVVVGIQFLISTLVVCVNLYKLTNTPFGAKYVEFMMYMACMMTQIFVYCWYGNQLKLKSMEVTDTISEMRWMEFRTDVRKGLLMIMRRVTVPIEFTSAYILTMDLKTFVGILKLSYSSYNFLQSTKEVQ